MATALMMGSTLGFSRVEPTNIELIVDDFLSSIISPLVFIILIIIRPIINHSLL